jgi:hypothetical protein
VLHWLKQVVPLILYFTMKELTWLSSKFRLHPERGIACDQVGPEICGVCDCGVKFAEVLSRKGLAAGEIYSDQR